MIIHLSIIRVSAVIVPGQLGNNRQLYIILLCHKSPAAQEGKSAGNSFFQKKQVDLIERQRGRHDDESADREHGTVILMQQVERLAGSGPISIEPAASTIPAAAENRANSPCGSSREPSGAVNVKSSLLTKNRFHDHFRRFTTRFRQNWNRGKRKGGDFTPGRPRSPGAAGPSAAPPSAAPAATPKTPSIRRPPPRSPMRPESWKRSP